MEIWKGSRVMKELQVPKDLHGSIYNDNWFSQEPAWNADETGIAYVAEVSILCPNGTHEELAFVANS